ncbi:MAG: V-type ATP synthase subunit I, partial [Schaedlerella sp.]|uniref:V-type ATP synthase subunit I n=1 Tax=Schaedlerella sp. TaxID=2676057 RepID=UPI003527BE29
MQRISICALKKNRKAILEKLQSMGVMEVSQFLEEDEDFRRMDTANARSSFEKAAASVDRALDILQIYAPEKKSMLSSLAGKELVDQKRYQQIIGDKETLLRTANQIQSLDRERAEQKSEILKLENSIESLTPWLPLEVPMDYEGTTHTEMLLGTMPGECSLEQIYSAIAEKAPEAQGFEAHIVSAGQEGTYLTVFCLREEAHQVEEALRSRGFARPSQILQQVPAAARSEMESEINSRELKIEEIEQQLAGLGVSRESLKLLADYYRVRADKYEVLGTLPQSERTFFISGYVPAKYTDKLKSALEGRYDCVVDVEKLKEDEEAPVLLQNNSFSESAEGILESYGLPAKGEVDPTAIMSVFYVFLFGLMLSDAAYGAIVSIACGAALKKFPRMEAGMKKSLKLFFWCGLSTLFWGVMFGGYFGDVVNVVSRTFFGNEVEIPALWFIPLNDPMKLLIYSMLFGLIHLFTGLGIKGYMCIKDNRYLDFFCDVVLWFLFLIGLIIMFLPTSIFASVAGPKIVFTVMVNFL